MLRAFAFRILQAVPVLLVMSIITFAIIQAPPGDYGDFIRTNMNVQVNALPEVAEAAAQKSREEHGLNDPLPLQYPLWIWGIVTGATSAIPTPTTVPSWIIEAFETGRVYRGHFNLRTGGTIRNLPEDCVIEAPGFADRFGIGTVEAIELPLARAATCRARSMSSG